MEGERARRGRGSEVMRSSSEVERGCGQVSPTTKRGRS